MATFGKTSNGTSSTASSADGKITSPATPSTSGTITSLTARIWLDSAGTCNWRGVIYSDSGGSPTNLLAVTDDGSFTNTSEAENTLNFTGGNQITINSGTTYWIGIHLQDPGTPSWNFSRDATANQRVTNGDDIWTGGADNPHSADKTTLSGPIDVYVTYSESGLANVKTINGLAIASVKTYNGLPIGSVKTINGLA